MRSHGFTLLEFLLVLAIIGILAGAFGFIAIRALRSAELRDAAIQVTSELKRARSTAQRGSTDVTLTWTGGAGGNTYTVGGRTYSLPNGIKLVCKTNCTTVPANSLTYQAPYGELSAVGSVFEIQGSSMVTPLEVRIVGVTGKVILARSSS